VANYHVFLKPSGVDPDARARAIYAVYSEILSLPDHHEKQTEPTDDDSGRDTAAGSEIETSASADETTTTHKPQKADEMTDGGSP
jgi:hypothetical protein